MIQRRRRQYGYAYRVRWYDEAGQERSKTFRAKADAEAWDAKVTLAKRTGEIRSLDAGRQTLEQLVEDWWTIEAPAKARNTQKTYASIWNNHLCPELGQVQIRNLTPKRIGAVRSELLAEGVGAPTLRKGLSFLQMVLEWAVENQELRTNPARPVKKPPAKRQHVVRVVPPATVEKLRAHLLAHDRVRDAALVCLLAYAGPRPDEALALPWSALRDATIAVGKQKTDRPPRALKLPAPLRADLVAWRVKLGKVDPDAPMFPAADGGYFTEATYRNWRKRVFQPATKACKLELRRPYDLRHTCASLMLHAGEDILTIARQLGHSPTMTLNVYGHLIAELEDQPRTSVEQMIRAAREKGSRMAAES